MKTKHIPFVCLLISIGSFGLVSAEDWPMYRRDHHHYGISTTELPATLYLQWVREYPALKSAWTKETMSRFDLGYQPVVAGKTMYVGSNRDDSLVAINTDTGAENWRFYADGPIRFAPIAINGKVYVGSDDGYVYCLNGATGVQIWKFRGGPAERRVFGNERLISTWPVRGAPVYYNGKIYFASGLWPWEGIFVYALNADTGAIVWKNDCGGTGVAHQPHSAYAVTGIAPQGQCVIKSTLDKLIVPNGHALPAFFNLTTGKLDKWVQGATRNSDGSNSFIDATGKPKNLGNLSLPGYPVQVTAGSKVYTTGPGVVGIVHDLIAADNKLFVTTREGRIYCFGGTPVSNPKTWATVITPLPAVSDGWTSHVSQMITQVGLGEGHCMVWGIGSGRLVEELARQSKYIIDVYDPDSSKVNTLRQKLSAAGLLGTRIALHIGSPMDIEFPPYTARLIASEDADTVGFASGAFFSSKLFHSLRPYGGTAWLPINTTQHATFINSVGSLSSSQDVVARNGNFSLLTRSGRLPGSTDFLNTTAATDISQDQVVKPPFGSQWYSDKYHFAAAYGTQFPHPDVVDGYLVSQTGSTYDVYTGLSLTTTRSYSGTKVLAGYNTQTYGTRINPLNGKSEDRMYYRAYGCSYGDYFGDMLAFRSGNPAYYHMPSESGPVNIGGMRPGCGESTQIPANGVFVLSSTTSCRCSYPIRTTLGLVHKPDGEQFTGWQDLSQRPVEDEPVRRVGLNFGAPGDRMASDKTLWVHKPAQLNNTPLIPTQIEPAATVEPYVHHTSWVAGGNSPAWVAASGIKGVHSVKINLGYPTTTALAGTPAIDGNLSDACWNGSAPIELYNPACREATNPKLQGLVYLRYDANKLYAAFNYFGSDPASLYKIASWDLFITDRLKYNQKYVHYRVDRLGVRYDGIKVFPAGEDETWSDAGWTSGYTTTATNFIVEMAIPWSTLTGLGLDKNTLAINVQGPKYSGNTDFLQLRNMTYRGEVRYWQVGGPTACTRFCPVGFGTPVGDLGKTRSHTVRMHFAEPDSISAGQRVFDIGLQGTTVTPNFDIAATAGGARKSIVKEFTGVMIRDVLTVNFTPKVGVPVISGIEIFETGSGAPVDATAPTVPVGVTASAVSSSQINLSWTASTDAVGVTGYNVYRGSTLVGTSTGTTYSDTGLTATTTYSYKVAAFDAAGNTSAQSAAASATTLSGSDITAPTVPTGLIAVVASSSQINLSWTASTDAVGVTGYKIFRGATQIGTSTSTSYSDTGLTASTAYSYRVSAYDAAGNNSAQSSVVSATTQAVVAGGDGDSDGLPDSWETAHFGSLAQAPSGDPDGDGFTNADEFKAGTSPISGSSRLNVSNESLPSSSSFKIDWQSVVGKTYEIQSSTDMVTWTTVASVTATSTSSTWTNSGLSGVNSKFYRVRIP